MAVLDPARYGLKMLRSRSACVALGVALAASAGAQTSFWTSPTSADWTAGGGADWTGGLPGVSSASIIAATGSNYTVSIDYTTGAVSTGTLALNSANATLSDTGEYLYLDANGGVSTILAGTLQLSNYASVIGYSSAGGHTLTNAGSVQSTGGYNYIFGNGGAGNGLTFTNAATGTVTVTGGELILGDGAGDSVTNLAGGVITANGATLTLNGGTSSIINQGTLQAINGGTINFGGNFTSAGLGGTINGTGGTLNFTGTLTNTGSLAAPNGGGIYTLDGGTIIGGTVNSSLNALQFSSYGGILDGVSMLGNFSLPYYTGFTVENGTTFNGNVALGGYNTIYLAGTGVALTIAPGLTWTASGQFFSYAQANNVTLSNQGTMALDGGSIDGDGYTGYVINNSGTIKNTGGALYLGNNYYYGNADTITNTGTLQADGLYTYLYLGGTYVPGYTGAVWTNAGGTIEATNGGTVVLGGTFTNATLTAGTISAAGGTVDLAGQLTNTGTLAAPNGGGIFTLYGGTIVGGTVDASANALAFSTSGGLLDGVTMAGNFSLPQSAEITVENGTAFTGNVALGGYNSVNLSGTTSAALTVAPGLTWTASGPLYIQAQASNLTLSNQGTMNLEGGTFDGFGNTGFAFDNSGILKNTSGTLNLGYYGYNDSDVIANTGTLQADGAGSAITIAGSFYPGYTNGTWTNTGGLIEATNGGTVNLGGTFTNATLTGGTINGSGGTLNLVGLLNNTGSLAAPNGGGIFTLYGGTISGGTVDASLNALTFGPSGGVLNDVAMVNNFNVPANGSFTVENGTTFSGNVTLAGNNTIYVAGSTSPALTIPAGQAWTDSGALNVSAQASSLTVSNQGTMTLAGGTISGDGYSGFVFDNSGSLKNTGGILYLGNNYYYYDYDTVTNTGTIQSDGASSVLTLAGPYNVGYPYGTWSNTGGLIEATNGGTVNLGGSFTNAALTQGTINATGGTVNLFGLLTNTGTLAAPDGGGVFTLGGGTIAGGTVNGSLNALTFSSVGGTLNGVSMVNNFNVPTNAGFTVENGTTFSGDVTLAGNNLIYLAGSTSPALTIPAGQTWTDSGSLTVYAQASSLTVSNQGTMTLSGGSINGNGNTGFVFNNAGTLKNTGGTLNLGNNYYYYNYDTVTNTGTLQSDGASSVLSLVGPYYSGYPNGTWSNAGGLIEATNGGTVNLGGSFTNVALTAGTINAAGGTVNITGLLTNTGTLAAPNGGGMFTLSGGTIAGGVIDGSLGALNFASGGILNGVSMTGSFTVETNGGFTMENGTTFSGSMALGGNNAILSLSSPNVTIGPGQSWVDSGALNFYAETGGTTFTNQGTLSVSGGNIEDYYYEPSGMGLAFVNSGTVTNLNGSLQISPTYHESVVNNGTIETEATGSNYSYLYIGDGPNTTVTNDGTIEISGSGAAYVGSSYTGIYASQVTNLAGGTLTGGTWIAANGGLLLIQGATPIVTIAPSTTLVINGTSSQIETYSSSYYQTLDQTLAVNGGTLELLGNRNFSATNPITNNGSIQLGGGTLTAPSLTLDPGSTLSGYGTFNPAGGATVGSGVLISPGSAAANQYVNTLSFGAGGLTFANGGAYTFDIVNSGASSVAGVDNDTINVAGTLTVNPSINFTISLESINSGTGLPGLANFSSAGTYQWTLLSATSISGFNASDFTINTSSFQNGLGIGGFNLTSNGSDIFLNFTPVPEPSTWAQLGAGVSAVALAALRRRRSRA